MDRIALVIGGKINAKFLEYENVEIFDSVTFSEAVEIALELEKEKKVDIIISPSGTALEIQKYMSIPIVKTNISDFDILESLMFAEKDSGIVGKGIALILHESKELIVEKFKPFLKNNLQFEKYQDEDDIKQIINKLISQGINLVVGGPTTAKIAEIEGLKGYIIRISDESLQVSIDKAKESLLVSRRYKEQSQRFKTALSLFTDGVMIVNSKGNIVECNEKARNIFSIKEDKIIGMNIEDLTNDSSIKNVYKYGVRQIDKFVNYGEINLFSNRFPIILEDSINGAVITLQEVKKISNLENKYRKHQTRGFTARYHFKDIMGKSDSITETINIARAFSDVDSDILIKGETGTGKELFAQSLHNASKRKSGPFVAINCAAFPESLLESELMGYEEGAFTGAKKGGKQGLFELAHMGTIFLDEINQLPIQLQGVILRVLQERQVLRIGGDKVIPINVRVIAATNESLGTLINEGKFRKDLYYRLSVLNLNIPPLRKRKGDVSLLINYYFSLFVNIYENSIPFDDLSLSRLEEHSWDGNIRELINLVERYVVISRRLSITPLDYVNDYLDIEDKNYIKNKEKDQVANQVKINLGTLKDMEKEMIEAVIRRYDNNKKQAALALGISRTSLYKKI